MWSSKSNEEKAEIKQETKSSFGFFSKAAAKGAISIIPFAGGPINVALEEAKNVKDNLDAKNKLIEELKYAILLIHSCSNLSNYITTNEMTQYLCDLDSFIQFNHLTQDLIKMLKEIRSDEQFKLITNQELEKIFWTFFKKTIKKETPVRQTELIEFKEKELQNLECSRNIDEDNVSKLIENIDISRKILEIAIFLLNEGRARNRLFILNQKGKIEYLSLEDFLIMCGLSQIDESKSKMYKSNQSKYLNNMSLLTLWINLDSNKPYLESDYIQDFIRNPDLEMSKKYIILILNYYVEIFIKTIETWNPENEKKSIEDMQKLLKKLYDVQTFLLNINGFEFSVLINAIDDPTDLANKIDTWASSLRCFRKGDPIPQTRIKTKEFISNTLLITDLVNYRININIIATQLNSIYQHLLLQVLQIQTSDVDKRDKILCPQIAMDLFK